MKKLTGSQIQTKVTAVDPFNLDPQDIHIEDIAQSLSNQCRFTGYTSRFYSVAEHSILCSILPSDEELRDAYLSENFDVIIIGNDIIAKMRLALLLHDASEAYISDIARPVKKKLDELSNGVISKIEDEILAKIFIKFGIPTNWRNAKWLRNVDDRMLFTEKRDLLPIADWGWNVEPYDRMLWYEMPSPSIEERFYQRFKELQKALA